MYSPVKDISKELWSFSAKVSCWLLVEMHKILVCTIILAIGLWMEPWGQAGRGTQLPTEFPPKVGHELECPVRDHILRKTTQAVCLSEGNLGRGMDHFGKAINHGKDHSIAIGLRETSNKIQCNFWPGMWRNGKGLQQTNGRLIWRPILSTNFASTYELTDVFCPSHTRVACKFGGVTPLQDGSADRLRNK